MEKDARRHAARRTHKNLLTNGLGRSDAYWGDVAGGTCRDDMAASSLSCQARCKTYAIKVAYQSISSTRSSWPSGWNGDRGILPLSLAAAIALRTGFSALALSESFKPDRSSSDIQRFRLLRAVYSSSRANPTVHLAQAFQSGWTGLYGRRALYSWSSSMHFFKYSSRDRNVPHASLTVAVSLETRVFR